VERGRQRGRGEVEEVGRDQKGRRKKRDQREKQKNNK
jgi:hypothetical protein